MMWACGAPVRGRPDTISTMRHPGREPAYARRARARGERHTATRDDERLESPG